MLRIVLGEYESVDLDLTRVQAEALARTGFVEIGPAPGGRWRLRAGSHVGTLAIDGLHLLIRPKIRPENLFLLLEPGLPPHAWRQEAFEYGTTSDLLPSVIGFFARALEQALAQGLYRSYRTRDERLVVLRGRIDIGAQIASGGRPSPIACSFDEFTEDNPENRILKQAVRRALRVPGVRPQQRARLMRELASLEAVTDAPIRPETVDAVAFTRLNEHYRPALGLARLVLEHVSLADRAGTTGAASFMVDMNDLFQRFVALRLRSALRGRLEVVEEPRVDLDAGRSIAMRPDLVLRDLDGEVRYVADIKYKLAEQARSRSGDYFQLLAYTTALELPQGLLIYCSPRDRGAERTAVVRATGGRLTVRAIDLAGSPAEVEQELLHLAERIVDDVRGRR